ncbi:uncharacterized protein LOC108910663 [Anoplophora glabripennis]|uniref:uncharacterized protein LOC108910663 n=1 Tax=Anoplophora glabripennis TaxID=217634 RepID=UPI0008739627|nr:uncharacterized protein LOC108910663 [Anoplophora glabripennis]
MSDRYPFTGDRAFTHNGTMVWNDQVAVQSSLDFSHVSDSTLTDSINESYATAVEDNETQYLSVLETTNDITLEDLHNLTLENSKIAPQENLQFENMSPMESLETNESEMNDQQVIVFSVEGSDDLYGIQFAQDEEGNMQKYQFKFRTTEEGQLEAIPESIQLLVNDIETHEKDVESGSPVQEPVNNEEAEMTETQVIYQEETEDIQETPIFEEQEELSEEHIQEEQCGSVQMFIKGEPEHEEEISHRQVFIDGESRDEELGDEQEIQYEENESDIHLRVNFEEEENVDVKTGILEESSTASNIKQELFQEESLDAGDQSPEEEEYHMYNQVDVKPVPYQEDNNEEEIPISDHEVEDNVEVDNGYVDVDEAQETVLEYEHYASEEIQHVYEETDTSDSQVLQEVPHRTHFKQVFIKEDAFETLSEAKKSDVLQEEEEDQEPYYAETGTENDSDNDEYQIVEGLHVTAEGDIDQDAACPPYQESDTILQEVVKKPPVLERANILKQPSLVKVARELKNKKTFIYYVVPHVEKENVNSLSVNYATTTTTALRPIRSNPRSILKSSFPEMREEPEVKALIDERFNKRFARSKEAVQARLFNNFISKTTIPHAPVRQTRLPRKQQIKPVDNRRDEEIIVQEVMVGSNGFIENVEEKLKNKDKLEVTQYVILTDSDEDYDPKKVNRKKKKHKKHKKGGDMDDAEDSDVSIIEIRSDDEETTHDQQESPKRGRGRPKKSTDPDPMDSTKRRRGRPPKSSYSHSDTEESPQKKSRTESDEIESDTTKKEFKCPHCIKTFPSQNSLSTHLHHHSLENRLRNSQANKAAAKNAITNLEYKYKCETCQASFKNSVLLKRHECPKQTKKLTKRIECGMCKRSFPDLSALNVHKRSHVKEKMVNTTSVTKVSPKKVLPRPSTSRPRSPKRTTSTSKLTFKCKDCSRVCFSQESLDLHEKTHRKFTCATCGATFSSRLLLDTHVRVSCVKASPQVNKRLSFKIKKSFVHSPRRRSIRYSRKSLVPNNNLNVSSRPVLNNSLALKLECEQCGEKFTMFEDCFNHKVKMHGLETPDKSILMEEKKCLHKPKSLHGGIPARDGMRKVFSDMRSKFALITPKKNSG